MPGGQRARRLGAAAERLAKLYEAWGRPDEAARWRAEQEKAAAAKP